MGKLGRGGIWGNCGDYSVQEVGKRGRGRWRRRAGLGLGDCLAGWGEMGEEWMGVWWMWCEVHLCFCFVVVERGRRNEVRRDGLMCSAVHGGCGASSVRSGMCIVHCGGDGGDDVSPSYAGDGGEAVDSYR